MSLDEHEDFNDALSTGSIGTHDVNVISDSRALKAKEEKRALARNEDRAVRALRIFTFMVILGSAILSTYGVFQIVRGNQEDTFQAEFEAGGSKIIESFLKSFEKILLAFDATTSAMTSYAIASGSTFPNVTFPDFEIRTAILRQIAGSVTINYCPYVTDETRAGYEAWSAENYGHLLPAFASQMTQIAIQDQKYGYIDEEDGDGDGEGGRRLPEERDLQDGDLYTFRPQIKGTGGFLGIEPNNTGPYLPTWQFSPILPVPGLLNFNALDLFFYKGPFGDVLNNSKAALGVMSSLNDPNDETQEAIAAYNASLGFSQYRHTRAAYENDPITFIGYPIFDSFKADRKIAAVMGLSLYWRLLFQDILPDFGSSHFTVVVKNSLGQAETYEIVGPEAFYTGSGDLHTPKYEEWEISVDIAEYLSSGASPESRTFTSVELNSNYSAYSLHIYPSPAMEADFLTEEPKIYAIIVCSIFAFTASIFMLYNCLVERRQDVVADKAVKSSAVVRSLFPENVHERLMNEAVGKTNDDGTPSPGWENGEGSSHMLADFVTGSGHFDDDGTGGARDRSRPIADFFKESTVFFADLAGFTKWSSTRKPEDVFGLLETIYGSFDVLAGRHKVFKVETIGDCYVAVTGVPVVQEDHAIAMTRFAVDCMLKLRKQLIKLADQYGDDTTDLNLRIGIHSGSVTAGVLRGDRARFQLFGDTVNTAARMESNGVPGRIHCSEATANILRKAGKEGWIAPRENKIVAKGKGEMQTYWIQPSVKSVKSGLETITTNSEVLDQSDRIDAETSKSTESSTSESSDRVVIA